jgi:hypothetical protein
VQEKDMSIGICDPLWPPFQQMRTTQRHAYERALAVRLDDGTIGHHTQHELVYARDTLIEQLDSLTSTDPNEYLVRAAKLRAICAVLDARFPKEGAKSWSNEQGAWKWLFPLAWGGRDNEDGCLLKARLLNNCGYDIMEGVGNG